MVENLRVEETKRREVQDPYSSSRGNEESIRGKKGKTK